MAFQTTPFHGKHASIFRYRPNGFKGTGLNDVTWGTGYNGAATGYFEAVIDGVGTGTGGVDTFKWRKNGGAWTETVDITGEAQTLSDAQTITFAATTGHTANDQWVVGNLAAEGTTESGTTAQITESTYRLCRPNKLTWTDSGGATVLYQEYANGKAYFNTNVATVTVAGNNSFIVPSALDQVGYLTNWSINTTLDMTEISRCGQKWKEYLPGMASASGSAEQYFIGVDSFFDAFVDNSEDENEKYFLLELYLYDPTQNQSGDKIRCWVSFNSFGLNTSVGEAVRETVNFQVMGIPSLIESA